MSQRDEALHLWKKRQRYKFDPVHRAAAIEAVKATHRVNLRDPAYVEMRRAYTRVSNLRTSLAFHRRKVDQVGRALRYWLEKRDVLRVEWKQKKER